MSLAGLLKLGWFSQLKSSALNCSLIRSFRGNILKMPMSQLLKPGPNSEFGAESPQANGWGTAYAAGLNHWESDGLPT